VVLEKTPQKIHFKNRPDTASCLPDKLDKSNFRHLVISKPNFSGKKSYILNNKILGRKIKSLSLPKYQKEQQVLLCQSPVFTKFYKGKKNDLLLVVRSPEIYLKKMGDPLSVVFRKSASTGTDISFIKLAPLTKLPSHFLLHVQRLL
jgi:hypothetical protein